MTLEDEIADYFEQRGYTWTLKGEKKITPTSKDVSAALDKAAAELYDGKPNDLIVVGRLIVIKTDTGFDVYMLAGSYK